MKLVKFIKSTETYKKIYFFFSRKKNLDKEIVKYKNLDNLFNHFQSDKGSRVINPYRNSDSISEKFYISHNFSGYYEKYLKNIKNNKLNILEIGVWKGASTASFFYYLPNSTFVAIDNEVKFSYKSNRVKFFLCDTSNLKKLSNLKKFFFKQNINKFDVIIDDCAHSLSNIINNFIFFFKFLKSGGIYVIEDFKFPNYFSYLNDLKNHYLVDEILFFIKKKKFFKSDLFSNKLIKYFIKNIKKIDTFKGSYIFKDGRNVSDIVFITRK